MGLFGGGSNASSGIDANNTTISGAGDLTIGVDIQKALDKGDEIRQKIQDNIVNQLDDWCEEYMLSPIKAGWTGRAYANFATAVKNSNDSLKNVLTIMANTMAANLQVQAENYDSHDEKLAEGISTDSLFGEVTF